MHDWTIVSIQINWTTGQAEVRVEGYESRKVIVAIGLRSFTASLEDYWGPSVSILQTGGPYDVAGGKFYSIQLQSGDYISIEACEISVFDDPNSSACSPEHPMTSQIGETDLWIGLNWESKELNTRGPLHLQNHGISRLFCSKIQPIKISNGISSVSNWVSINESRAILLIETDSGDRIQIEELRGDNRAV